MPNSKNQKGLAPVIIILGLMALSAAAAGGYYLFTNQDTVPPAIVQPAQSPLPSVTQGSSIEEVKIANEAALLNMEGVEKVEVGEKDGEPCVVVFTFEETDELENLENNGLNGYKVVVLPMEQ